MTTPTETAETDIAETAAEEVEMDEPDYPDYNISPEEGRRQFDEAARRWIGMSGEEVIRHWEAGEFWRIADRAEGRNRGMVDLIMAIPLARQAS